MNTCALSTTFCQLARYAESYSSKVEMLTVLPITISILMLTLRGYTSCTTLSMVLLCTAVWIVPALYLGTFTLLGALKPGSFYVVFANDSRRCDFGGEQYHRYVLGESVLFFYFPVFACVVMYSVVGYFQIRYRVLGVARLVRRGLWITFFYCLCWVPFMVVLSLAENGHLDRSLLLYTYLFFYISVIVNPLVYVFTSKPFQIRLQQFLSARASPQTLPDPDIVHVNDQASFEVGRGAGSLVETTSGMEGVVTMEYDDDSDTELVDAY